MNPSYKLAVAGSIYCDSTLFTSNITVLGDYTVLNTTTSNTEQVDINNSGTGPALQVRQTGQQPVAYFYDDNNIALTVADGGFVGVGTTNPAYPCEIIGTLNINGSIYQNGAPLITGTNATNITTGTLNAAILPTSGVTASTYGSASSVAQFTVDNKGRLTTATSIPIAITSGAVSGLAVSATTDTTNATNINTGTLNAAQLPPSGVTASTYGSASSVAQFTVDNKGRLTTATSIPIAITSGAVSGLAASATTDTTNATNINTGTLNAAQLPTSGVTANTYGSASSVAQFTVDNRGRLTTATSIPIAITSGAVSGLAASATTDTTNATNINTGTLNAAQLPTSGVTASTYGSASSVAQFTVDNRGRLTTATSIPIAITSGAVSGLAASATTDTTNATNINKGTLNAAQLPTSGVTANTYGQSNVVPRITVDIYGRITNVTNSTQLANVAVTGDYNDLLNTTFKLNGISAFYNNGNVGIGTSTPTAPLEVIGRIKATQFIGDGSQLTGVTSTSVVSSQWSNSNVGSSSNIFFNSGFVGIGTSSPSYLLHVNGNMFATNVMTYSDAKYKRDVATIENALDIVNNMRGVTYRIGEDAKTYMGVIAQEIEPFVPEAVNTDVAGMKSVSYGNMVGLLIEAIKDMTKIIKSQQQDIDRLSLRLCPSDT
jgi:uncharacterized membrane protein